MTIKNDLLATFFGLNHDNPDINPSEGRTVDLHGLNGPVGERSPLHDCNRPYSVI